MNKLRAAWVISLVATCGSLFFSEVMHFIPCSLCWYQRILMYTLPIYFGIAIFKNQRHVVFYTLPVTILGFLIGTFQYLEQKISWFSEMHTCKVGVPCTTEYINWLGFITIPFLSLTAFFLISILSIYIWRDVKKETH
ncbi:disulfide bond formation protein B [Priestia megaterium]|nr:disulfide bond formation protein B [Priestia megaterium]